MSGASGIRSKPMRNVLIGFLAVLIGAVINISLGLGSEKSGGLRVSIWFITLICTIALLMCIGQAINKRLDGIIIDARNKTSLSKLQATAWTVLVGSALATYAAARSSTAGASLPALGFGIPNELLIAMGISGASLVAAPAVLSLKTGDGSTLPWDVPGNANIDDVDGRVAGRTSPDKASWLDIFRGDEVGNAGAPDLSKVQQFLISIVLITVYGSLIAHALYLGGEDALASLPPLDKDMVWLLGISHAAYIGYKAVPHSGSDTNSTESSVG